MYVISRWKELKDCMFSPNLGYEGAGTMASEKRVDTYKVGTCKVDGPH